MQLESMWVHGMRRFGGSVPTRLRLDSPLVCLIGANEVGKSTILDALELAHNEETDDDGEWRPVPAAELTRKEAIESNRLLVRLRYRLSKEERAMLGELGSAGRLRTVRWLEVKKFANGAVEHALDPIPTRDKTSRHGLAERLEKELEDTDGVLGDRAEGTAVAEETVKGLASVLSGNNMYISEGYLSRLRELAAFLEKEERDQKLVAEMRGVLESEEKTHPLDEAREALGDLIPQFVSFELRDRELADEYDLATQAAEPPPSLRNLAELANLDLEELLKQIQGDLTGSVEDTKKAANEELKRRFEAWTQKPPVKVSLDTSGTRLLVHVQSGSGATMKIRERSEGLRQFVALVALTAGEGHAVPPILLIDEAERHLHYDAQADLIGVLEEQDRASQVIYTTHSAACLPADLGAGVRVVRGVEDQMLSTIEQQFWSDDAGLVTLLLAMGAGSLAFVPLRPAAIVEGGSDLVLLPSLMKEACDEDLLGFQVVPGAANVPPQRVAGLDLHGVNTVWILDGDSGGVNRRKFLIKNKVPSEQIHLLKVGDSGIDLEDLIHAKTYVKAINEYVADVGGTVQFDVSLLPEENCARHKNLEKWCTKQGLPKPGKTAIANKVLELRGSEPLCEPHRRVTLRALRKAIVAHFEREQETSS
jgi:hypothetical protein